ncbi:hypothetical protein K449DRAFT_218713 [Hypoxylon sp. EC38]|nr:hypothetical protein K449DRAFT_218713 [Hypoxylon sp. EC38]
MVSVDVSVCTVLFYVGFFFCYSHGIYQGWIGKSSKAGGHVMIDRVRLWSDGLLTSD